MEEIDRTSGIGANSCGRLRGQIGEESWLGRRQRKHYLVDGVMEYDDIDDRSSSKALMLSHGSIYGKLPDVDVVEEWMVPVRCPI